MGKDIRDMQVAELEEVLVELDQPKYRAKQVYEWLHTHNANDYSDMTNLPKALREVLGEQYPLGSLELVEREDSIDGSRKYLFKLSDGNLVEAVGIVSGSDEDEAQRLTVCFSTQVGCGMECKFCATGQEGFIRNLTSSEMVQQISFIQKDFASDSEVDRVSNVVAMGQGEPFMNYEELIAALQRINTDKGLGIGARHITVSTSGILSGISKFTEEPEQYRLAISLHSANQQKRDQLMPRLSNQPLKRLKDALIDYNLKKNRRVTIEYLMIDDVNDSDKDLEDLIDFCKGIHCHVNLIPMNSVEGTKYHPSSMMLIRDWEAELSGSGIPTSIRRSKGSDINGACGQLKNKPC